MFSYPSHHLKIIPVEFIAWNLRNNSGNTALHLAGMAFSLKIIQKLIEKFTEKGIDIDVQNNTGLTPLDLASVNIRK